MRHCLRLGFTCVPWVGLNHLTCSACPHINRHDFPPPRLSHFHSNLLPRLQNLTVFAQGLIQHSFVQLTIPPTLCSMLLPSYNLSLLPGPLASSISMWLRSRLLRLVSPPSACHIWKTSKYFVWFSTRFLYYYKNDLPKINVCNFLSPLSPLFSLMLKR